MSSCGTRYTEHVCAGGIGRQVVGGVWVVGGWGAVHAGSGKVAGDGAGARACLTCMGADCLAGGKVVVGLVASAGRFWGVATGLLLLPASGWCAAGGWGAWGAAAGECEVGVAAALGLVTALGAGS